MAKEVLVNSSLTSTPTAKVMLCALTAEDKAETDKMAEKFGIKAAYEVVEEPKEKAVASKKAKGHQ